MGRQRRHPRSVLALACAGLLALTTACGQGTTQQAAAGSAPAADEAAAQIDKFLMAPKDAPHFSADPVAAAKGPVTGRDISLPYTKVLPLPDGPIGDPNKTYTFCFSQALTGSTWAVAQQESVMMEAAKHPNVKLLTYNTNNDPLKQVADLESCAAQKADAFLIWPYSVEPLTPEIEKLTKSGAVVVGMERTVATDQYSTWIYLDHDKATSDMADAIGKKLGGKGTIVETDGAIGSSPQILWRTLLAKHLKEKYPDIKVEYSAATDYSRGQGYKVALDYLQSHQGQQIDGWFTQYSEIGFGVAQALKDYKRSDIPHFTVVDGDVAVQAAIDGTFTAISPWSPVHADVAFRAAVYHLTDKEVPKQLALEQPPVITQESAAKELQLTWPG
ncbi:substrate-binding domain-containing protein [Arthrobacter sp. I2-34]|uniref:Substrate-binding domain-containing protein n=1 Tax=Arthrobacter hankyongi TaxID=2904801 RepID=A0ABS9LCM8_9MICC|nr:substrate-binding domain-containing protein [Arthrobacter hankyongi]MCG2624428.1 substrate-binding domain-containing protein [Arthrobacter hankyongi]